MDELFVVVIVAAACLHTAQAVREARRRSYGWSGLHTLAALLLFALLLGVSTEVQGPMVQS